MPSEYQKWVARNEKPQEVRELTPAEKRQNWWYYHKWQVLAVCGAILLIVGLISSRRSNELHGPDLQIAYVGKTPLSDTTVAALETALAAYGTDNTGDGNVRVAVRQYLLGDDMMTYTQLELDLTTGESRIFLLEDPEAFQTAYGALSYGDGVFPEDVQRDEPLWHRWADCPVLTGLDVDEESKARLQGLFIGRRGIESGYRYGDADNQIWAALTEGAA